MNKIFCDISIQCFFGCVCLSLGLNAFAFATELSKIDAQVFFPNQIHLTAQAHRVQVQSVRRKLYDFVRY